MWCYILSKHFAGMLLFFCIIYYDRSHSDISVYAISYNNSEEIKNIFSLSYSNNSVIRGEAVSEHFAKGRLINDNLVQSVSKISLKNYANKLSNGHKKLFDFTSPLSGQKMSSHFNNATRNNSFDFLQTPSTKISLPTKLIESGSNLFLGVPEVIHINGTSSIKPRKGVHYSKIVPRKGVDSENEAIHISLENQSCFWLTENECYTNKEMQDLECICCKEDNILGKNIKETPVKCKNCRTFNVLMSEGNQTCKNICCNALNKSFYPISSTLNTFSNYLDYQTVPSAEKRQHYSHLTAISKKKLLSDSPKNIAIKKNNTISFQKNFKFKPDITKVPYDAESMTELLSKTQEKIFVPLAVSLFLLPLMGLVVLFLWQRTKEYWNKRYYKRMDFLIDGIYND